MSVERLRAGDTRKEANAGAGGAGAPPTSKAPNRAPDLARLYVANGITVEWYASRCIHSANCVRALPHVLDPRARPWVTPTADIAGRIVAAIERCPSGALRYARTDGGWTEPRRDSLEGGTGGPESAAPSGDGDDPAI